MSHLTRGPNLWLGIGSKASADGHRHHNAYVTIDRKEVSA
jgi:hypothetical protein